MCGGRDLTQIPPSRSPGTPEGGNWRDVKVGGFDGSYVKDRSEGRHILLMWAFRQNLVFEADLDVIEWKDLESFALQAYEGQRTRTPSGCDDERSDLAQESLVAQLANHEYRMFLADGCPVRLDVASLGALDENHHCWPGLENGRLGEARFYKDPDGALGHPAVAARFDGDAELPVGAIASGYVQGDTELWADPADGTVVYVVSPGRIEAWPVTDEVFGCA